MKKSSFHNRALSLCKACSLPLLLVLAVSVSFGQYQMEKLNRGVVAVRSGTNNFITWRWLGTEDDITFNLYRNGTKVNSAPLTVTNYTDNGAPSTAQYYVRTIVGGVEQPASETVSVWGQNYLQIPLQIPAGGTSPDDVTYTYSPNDCSVGDVDGDGAYEIFVKWDPSNSKDNSQSGYTGNVYIDCYRLNGTRLWRIDLGRNIRAGAHYTQFMVYDFDGDGKAEMMCKTSDATIDGKGVVIGNAGADYRNSSGYVLSGSEFLTVFNGSTGGAMATVNYVPARGTVSSWGDNYGNRVDRFRAGVAYLDGKKPSAVFCRGYYTRLVMAAFDWNGTTLSNRWTFDSGNSSSNAYYGQGDHSLSIADVDNDGKHEIISGAAIIDDNGTGYYSTGYGHGDALHVSDFDPTLPGLEVFNIQEQDSDKDCYLYSATQKKVLWSKSGTSGIEGPGRAVAANITEQFAGAECWIAGGGVSGGPWQVNGQSMGTSAPSSVNFLSWWDGDLAREIANGTTIDKYPNTRLLTASGCSSNNGTKSNPGLSGDIIGDWREELVVRSSNNDFLRIYTTTTASNYKIRTLLHDPQYRVAIAWQNGAYNQPPHPSFYLGDGYALPPKPNITIVGGTTPVNKAPTVSITSPATNSSFNAPASITINATATDEDGTVSKVEFYQGSILLGSDASAPYSFTWTNVAAGNYTLTAKVTDNNGAVTTSASVTVVVSTPNQSPVISITSPSNNAVFTSPASVTINATASDPDGTVSTVEFYNGTTLLGTDASSPYSFTWANVQAGTYTLTAKAIDNLGAAATSSAVSITLNPPSGITIQAETACTANGILNESTNTGYNGTGYLNLDNATGSAASWVINSPSAQNMNLFIRYANGSANNRSMSLNVNGSVQQASVDFLTTGAWTTWNIVSVPVSLTSGRNSIVLTSLMAEGAPNLDELTFSATSVSAASCTPPNVLPTVSVTAPANNTSVVYPATLTITAQASDADGSIASVEFYQGTALLGNDASAPYSFTWTNASPGTYVVTAKAIDNAGGSTTSASISVIVTAPNVNPTITVTTPLNNSSTSANSITVSGSAGDADGSISKIECYSGSTVIGTSLNSPFSFVWDNPAEGTHEIVVKATDNNGGVTMQSVNITVTKITGIFNSSSRKTFTSIHPNPSAHSFTLTPEKEVAELRVIDMYGKELISMKAIATGGSVEIGDQLSAGTYLIVLTYDSGETEIGKLVKGK